MNRADESKLKLLVSSRSAIVAASALAITMAASAASAGNLTIEGGNLVTSDIVTIHTPSLNGEFYAAPLSFQIETPAGGPVKTLYGFCVDLFHEITAPINSPLTYVTGPLTTDFGSPATTLTSTQVGEIGALANLGAGLIVNGKSTDLADQLAAIQVAIWQVEEPSPAYSFTSSSSTVTGLVSQDESWAAAHQVNPASVTVISPAPATTQCCGTPQAFAIGAVPEPATWTMMIVGVGLMGVALRRRRAAAQSGVANAA